MTNYYNALVNRIDAVSKKTSIAQRCWQLCLLMMFSIFTATSSLGQTIVVGTGALTSATFDNGAPVYRSSAVSTFGWSQSVHLYQAAALTGMPGASEISSFGFYKTNTNTMVAGRTAQLRVYMKNTSNTTVSTTQTLATWILGATLVYQNLAVPASFFPTTAGLVPVPLTTPFIYSGGSLEVYVDWAPNGASANLTTGSFLWSYDAATPSQNVGFSANAAITTALISTLARRYRASFTYAPSLACTGTPAPGNTLSSTASACSGVNFDLTLQNITSGSGVTYQWESADDMAFTAGVTPLGTSSSQTTSLTSAKYYRCTVTCAASSTTSTPVAVGLNGFIGCYCQVLPTGFFGGDDIRNVVVDAFANPTAAVTSAAGSFTSFNNAPITISSPSTQPMSITVGTDGNQATAVWIDFNQNGVFETSENVALSATPAVGNAVVSYSLAIPSGATPGLTRMRVRGGSDAAYTAAGACTVSQYGETEDYLVTIVASVPCVTPTPGNTVASAASVCVGVPFTLSVQNVTTGTGVTLQWESADDMAFTAGVTALGTAVSQAIPSQTSAKYYRCVVTCSTGPDTVASTPVLVGQNAPTGCYCTPVTDFGCADGDVIARVQLNTLDNNTGTGCPSDPDPASAPLVSGAEGPGYSDYTNNAALTTTLQAGSTYACTVSAGQFSESYAAWIDYNDDGVFDQATEKIGFTSTPVAGSNTAGVLGSTASFPITLSCSPPIGVHRLRVRAMFSIAGNLVTPCGNNAFGEVEDYLITITAADPCPAPSLLTATVATTTSATLGWKQGCVETVWDVFVQQVGASVPTGATTPTESGVTTTSAPGFGTYDVAGLTAGSAYEYYVRSSCDAGASLYSIWAGPFTFISVAPGCTVITTPAVTTALPLGITVINWIAPAVSASQSAATSYDVYFGTTSGALALGGNFVSGPLNYTINAYGTSYVQIIPKNAAGVAIGCAETTFVTIADPCDGTIPAGDNFAIAIDLGVLTGNSVTTGNNLLANCYRNDYTSASTPGNALARPGRDVFYKFEITDVCSTLTIGTCVNTFDTYLQILNASGVRINGNDDGCAPGSVLTGLTLAPGVYYAVVQGYLAGSEGTFTLDIAYATTPAITYYQDADGDTYGNPAVSIAACTAPTGYVLDNTDCLDTNATAYLGAFEIAFDGVDNNCDGQIDEGSILTTNLIAASCNVTLPAMSKLLFFNSAANATRYRVRATNTVTGSVGTYETTSTNFRFTNLSSYEFGATYDVDVEVQRLGVWLNYYGTSCPVTTNALPTLTVGAACVTNITTRFSGITTTNVAGALQYKFRVLRVAPGAVAQEITTNWNGFLMHYIGGFVYGSTYNVEVAVKTPGASAFSTYGSPCVVNTPAVPTLAAGSCDVTVTSNFQAIATTNLLTNATGYKFEITSLAGVVFVEQASHWFYPTTIPGYLAGTNYSVRVAVKNGADISEYGEACELNPVVPARFGQAGTPSAGGTDFKAVGSPNPFATNFILNVTTTSDEKVKVAVYDMIGKQLESKEVNATDANALEVGANYPAGVYNVIVSQGVNVKSLRMIKR